MRRDSRLPRFDWASRGPTVCWHKPAAFAARSVNPPRPVRDVREVHRAGPTSCLHDLAATASGKETKRATPAPRWREGQTLGCSHVSGVGAPADLHGHATEHSPRATVAPDLDRPLALTDTRRIHVDRPRTHLPGSGVPLVSCVACVALGRAPYSTGCGRCSAGPRPCRGSAPAPGGQATGAAIKPEHLRPDKQAERGRPTRSRPWRVASAVVGARARSRGGEWHSHRGDEYTQVSWRRTASRRHHRERRTGPSHHAVPCRTRAMTSMSTP